MVTEQVVDTLEYEQSLPIHFPGGLIGMAEWRSFVLLSLPESGPFKLLQSLEEERLSFFVVNPWDLYPGYELELDAAEAASLQLPSERDEWEDLLETYCIVSVEEEPLDATVNLLGPLVINPTAGIGVQIILSRSGYPARFPLATGDGRAEVS